MPLLKDKIEKVITDIINPRLTMHNGGVELISVDEEAGVVTIKFSGMCLGCPMADMTFNGIVEAELLSKVSGLKQVLMYEEGI